MKLVLCCGAEFVIKFEFSCFLFGLKQMSNQINRQKKSLFGQVSTQMNYSEKCAFRGLNGRLLNTGRF